MKIVLSSTVEQEQEIANLVSYLYDSVFPKFFTEEEIRHFQEIGVLQVNKSDFPYSGTLRSAFQVIACLQVMIVILEKKEQDASSVDSELVKQFEQNITLLNEYGIFFPFYYKHFNRIQKESPKNTNMMYTQPDNEFLI
ncbi:DUF5365 family protein [Peribacillus asahii]|uniref:DUF5365 family protein n=1 Tax=Peribacillus asahii TaxID=228899 RepID=UPI0038028C71